MGNPHEADALVKEAVFRQRMARLGRVLQECRVFEDDYWLDMADEAVIWAFVTLSGSERRKYAEDLFFAAVDFLYASSFEAEETYSPAVRQRISSDAEAVRDRIVPHINAIIQEATAAIKQLDENDVRHIAGTSAHLFRAADCMETIPIDSQCELIIACAKLCLATECAMIGVDTDNEFLDAATVFCKITSRLMPS